MGVNVWVQAGIKADRARSNHVLEGISESMLGVTRTVRSVRGAVLFPEEKVYQDQAKDAATEYEGHIGEVTTDIRDKQQSSDWEEFKSESNQLLSTSSEILDLVNAGKIAEAKAKLPQLEMSKLDNLKSKLEERQLELLGDIRNKDNIFTTISLLTVIIGLIVAVVISLVMGNRIASGIAKDVKIAIAEISAASNEIAATMEQQERTASLQAASVSETTTTMDELGASSQQSQEQAEAAAQAAQEVLALAGQGNQSVEETVASMIDLKNKVAAIADQIVRLSEQTNQIGNISELVADLSQQTNMLALNASVEAVRAGEHGKGFAVVAEEIRKLADQSRQSAANIGGLVSDIQNAINTTVMVTDEGTKTVNAGMNVTENTANAFAGVLESINNVAMNNQQIALNIRQQGKAVQQVLDAMADINKGAQENAAGITQVKTGTQQLGESAKTLEAIL
ncbi:MAG: methyl-accepting chemotaxis protein [Synechocystis sp.]